MTNKHNWVVEIEKMGGGDGVHAAIVRVDLINGKPIGLMWSGDVNKWKVGEAGGEEGGRKRKGFGCEGRRGWVRWMGLSGWRW